MKNVRRAFVTGIGGVGPQGTGHVPDGDTVWDGEGAGAPSLSALACGAARQALASAGLDAAVAPATDASLHVRIGCATGSRRAVRQLALDVAGSCGAGGSSVVVECSGTSAAEAVGGALDLVRAGRAERVVCGSAEGAWMVLVESEESTSKRGARAWAEIAGFGSIRDPNCDSSADGHEAARALYLALHDALQSPEAIDIVHVSAKPGPAEMLAVHRVFAGGPVPGAGAGISSRAGRAPVASGGAGIVAALLAMREDFETPPSNREARDPGADSEGRPEVQRREIRSALCSDLEGERCAAVVLRRVE